MKKRQVLMLLSTFMLFLFYFPAEIQGIRLFDIMHISHRADETVGFVRLCMWDWSGIPLTLMYFSGAMLLSVALVKVNPAKRWKRVGIDVAVGLYAVLFASVFLQNYHSSEIYASGALYALLPILPLLAILLRHIRAMQIVVCAISGVLLIWGVIVCVVDYKEGAYAFDYFAACMLIPTTLLLRGLLFPNSRIGSIVSVAVMGWSAYFIVVEFILQMNRSSYSGIFLVMNFIGLIVPILCLICLIIDTIFVFLSHRKAAIPAAPGDPPEPAEE